MNRAATIPDAVETVVRWLCRELVELLRPVIREEAKAASRELALLAAVPGDRAMSEKDLAHYLGVSARTIRRMVKKQVLPEAVDLGDGRKRWTREQIWRHRFHEAVPPECSPGAPRPKLTTLLDKRSEAEDGCSLRWRRP